jgi:hypothetical protein
MLFWLHLSSHFGHYWMRAKREVGDVNKTGR